jgi:hypothetical protein
MAADGRAEVEQGADLDLVGVVVVVADRVA